MAPRPKIPRELTRRPFCLEEAGAVGITRTALRGRSWRHLGTDLYCWAGLQQDPWKILVAWRRALPVEAVFAGPTAAWLHGIDLHPIDPIEVIVAPSSGVRSRAGLKVRRTEIAKRDVMKARGLPATTVNRTLSDLSARLPAVEALVAIDAALRLRLIDKSALRCHGRLQTLAEPAESPMETRLRWLLFEAGLPCPEVQTDLHDAGGRFVGRADLYYPLARLVIEYDGGSHRERLVEDNRRQNLLVDAGFRVLRFTAADLRQRPAGVVALVRSALTRTALVSGTARRAEAGSG